MKSITYTSPEDITGIKSHGLPTVFLAGSIGGAPTDWQQQAIQALGNGFVTLNPRRKTWPTGVKEEASNPMFKEQVLWEFEALKAENSDCILMYFDPKTQAPISLLEFGKHIKSGRMAVVCPSGFWKRGNIEIECQLQDVALHENLGDAIEAIKVRFAAKAPTA